MSEKKGFFQGIGTKLSGIFGAAGAWFKKFGVAVTKGDIFVKLSLLIMGAQHFRRKQIIKGIIMTLFEVVIVAYTALVGIPYISKLGTLGTVEREIIFNVETMQNETNDFDHSFKILLFGIISVILLIVAVIISISDADCNGCLNEYSGRFDGSCKD